MSDDTTLPRRTALAGAAIAGGAVLAASVSRSAEAATNGTDYVNVKTDFGARGDNRTDDTEAFRNAAATNKTVFVPPGIYYGTFDLDPIYPRFVGTDAFESQIRIAAGHHFIDGSRPWGRIAVDRMSFVGGAGAIRNRTTSTNVTDIHRVLDCQFRGYTKAAISTNTSDGPLWNIERCSFSAGSQNGTIGIALNGLTDQCTIRNCEFQLNQIHIKLGYGGNNAKIQNCDFVYYAGPQSGLRRANVWVSPSAGPVNAGAGLVVDGCKFGNENLGASDFRILIANQGSGAYFGERLPDLGNRSGHVSGHIYRDCNVNGGGTALPLVYSAIDNYRGNQIRGFILAGGYPSMVLQYANGSAGIPSDWSDNQIGPMQTYAGGMNLRATNRAGAAVIINPPKTAHSTNLF